MKTRTSALTMFYFWFFATLSWWALAFAPVGGDRPPQWLEQARSVCFGTTESGLPDTGGWMVLTLGPLSFLLALFIIYREDLFSAFQNLLRTNAGKVLLIFTAAAFLWETSWVGFQIHRGLSMSRTYYGSELRTSLPEEYPLTDYEAPDFQLVDQNGDTVSLATFRGKPVILTFAFAHCQTVCPMLVQQATTALKKADDIDARLLVITLDPWRDTPGALPTLAQKWQLPKQAHVLSGKVEDVLNVINAYKIPWNRDSKNGDIQHPALTYVISPSGRIAFAFNNASPEWLTGALRRLQIRYSRNH